MSRKQFNIPSIKSGEFILKLKEDSKLEYLIHYAAPFTLNGEIVVPAGFRFSITESMRDDAFYIYPFENNDSTEADLLLRMNNLANKEHPELSKILMGFSFFITDLQIKSECFSFIKGNKEYLLDIVAKNKEKTEYYENNKYNPWVDEEYKEKHLGGAYKRFCECGKPKVIAEKTELCPCCGYKLRPVYWGKITEEIAKLKMERKIFIGEELYGKDDAIGHKENNSDNNYLQEYTKPNYACGNCGESFVLKNK